MQRSGKESLLPRVEKQSFQLVNKIEISIIEIVTILDVEKENPLKMKKTQSNALKMKNNWKYTLYYERKLMGEDDILKKYEKGTRRKKYWIHIINSSLNFRSTSCISRLEIIRT